jgi:hypothetical protein
VPSNARPPHVARDGCLPLPCVLADVEGGVVTPQQRAEIRAYIRSLLDHEPEGEAMNAVCDAVSRMIWWDAAHEIRRAA